MLLILTLLSSLLSFQSHLLNIKEKKEEEKEKPTQPEKATKGKEEKEKEKETEKKSPSKKGKKAAKGKEIEEKKNNKGKEKEKVEPEVCLYPPLFYNYFFLFSFGLLYFKFCFFILIDNCSINFYMYPSFTQRLTFHPGSSANRKSKEHHGILHRTCRVCFPSLYPLISFLLCSMFSPLLG